MEKVKIPAWKRTTIGLMLGLGVGFATFIFATIPLFGLIFVAMQTPAYLVADIIPSLEYYHAYYLVLLIWSLIGAILGYLYAYKKTFILAVILVCLVIAGTTLQFIKEFAETMSNF